MTTTQSSAAAAKEQAREQFEKWALTYDRSALNELLFFPCIRLCQEEILRWQAERDGRPYAVLDVGCGTGTLLSLLSQQPEAARLVGLDYSPAMVKAAAEKFAHLGERLEAVEGDAEHLPFEEGAFDVLTCCNSFHHYPHQRAAVAEFRRVLRPGGLLLLLDGFRDNWIGWTIFQLFVANIEGHVRHARWHEVRAMIEAAGFGDVRQRKMNVLAPVLVNVARC